MFHKPIVNDADLFIKELGKRCKKNDIGVVAEFRKKFISVKFKIYVKLYSAGVHRQL